MQDDRTDVRAVDQSGAELQVGDRVAWGSPLTGPGGGTYKITEISPKVSRVGQQFGGYEFRSVRLKGFGWANPVSCLTKVNR